MSVDLVDGEGHVLTVTTEDAGREVLRLLLFDADHFEPPAPGERCKSCGIVHEHEEEEGA